MEKYNDSIQRRATLLSACIASSFASPALAASPQGFVHYVTSCDDDGPGTLRDTLRIAGNGTSVSFDNLQCSTITLTSGELEVAVDYLYIVGNAQTITAANASRVISHTGQGQLTLRNLTISDGYLTGSAISLNGGCIDSNGSLILSQVAVTGCRIATLPNAYGMTGRGGGVYARGDIQMDLSSVTGNVIAPPSRFNYNYSAGNGIAARGHVTMSHSLVSGNTFESECGVVPGECFFMVGGGIYANGGVTLYASTVSDNTAYRGAGVMGGNANTASHITNSTISGNHATYHAAGVYSRDALLDVDNSTIAFNASDLVTSQPSGAGIELVNQDGYLSLHSTIVAGNTRGGRADDVYVPGFAAGQIAGESNLVVIANRAMPPDTISEDPLLGPLQDNGSGLPTHGLLAGSPAIDAGSNGHALPYDERGALRVTGARADIGAFEVQQPPPPDAIFQDGFD